jgi:hypothetical protein
MTGFDNRDPRLVREFGGYGVTCSLDRTSEDIETGTEVANGPGAVSGRPYRERHDTTKIGWRPEARGQRTFSTSGLWSLASGLVSTAVASAPA